MNNWNITGMENTMIQSYMQQA